MSAETLVILNPESAAGVTRRRAEALEEALTAKLGPVQIQHTRAPGDATQLARAACQAGVQRLLVAGGDGTTSEIATGLLAEPVARRPSLGLLPFGSGWDLARSLSLPRRLDEAIGVIRRGATRRIDAGRIEYRDRDGAPRSRCFVNEASCGLSGQTVHLVGRTSKRLGPRIGFAVGAVGAILSHRPDEMALEIDDERVYEGPVSMIVIANGCYFGAGMKVAPRAVVDDGRFEVVLVRGLTLPRLLANLPSLYAGRHLGHPSVSRHAARRVALLPKHATPPIDADGEGLGTLPLSAEILPAALEVFVPGVGSASTAARVGAAV